MSYTYDTTTSIGRARLLGSDTDTSYPVFTDEQVQAFLDMESGNVRRAAASMLEVMAANQAFIMKKIETLDLKLDGPALAAEFRALAKQYRETAETGAGAAFAIAEMVHSPSGAQRRLWNQIRRGVL